MRTASNGGKSVIYVDGKYEKRKKTRFLTIILTFENCDMLFDFVILLEAHHGPDNCFIKMKTTEKRFLDPVKLSQTFVQLFIASKRDFHKSEILNNFICTTP